MSKVSDLLLHAFAAAAVQLPTIRQSWIQASFRAGFLLPGSLLMVNIQKIGDLDIVLRCMEEERRNDGPDQIGVVDLQNTLSNLWVGSVYEIIRVLKERGLATNWLGLDELLHDLTLLRIPLEKHEIAKANRKSFTRLELRRIPPNNDGTDAYVYQKDDPLRAHIMPSGVSQRGFIVWMTIDLENKQERVFERQELSERALATLSLPPSKP